LYQNEYARTHVSGASLFLFLYERWQKIMWLLVELQLSTQAADFALGPWTTQDRNAIVRMAPCISDATRLCGTIAQILTPSDRDALDAKNPDPKLRARPVLGLTILTGFTPHPGDERCPWRGGRAYDPAAGKSYSDIELCVKDADHMVLTKELHLGPFQSGVSAETWSRARK
jgi:uncharacterized protein (DUF2147 family)